LAGGAGNDQFLLGVAGEFFGAMGIDTIAEFTDGDKIVLSRSVFTSLTSIIGNGFSLAGEFAIVLNKSEVEVSDALIVYNPNTGGLFYNQNGTAPGFGSGGQLAALTGNTELNGGDFSLSAQIS
jgi:Ca2+-binding RTX toxin-like protein